MTELERFAHAVGSGEEDVTQLFERLELTTKKVRSTPEGYTSTVWMDDVVAFIRENYPDKYLSAKLFSTELIGSWLGALQSGDDCYPPMDEIHSAWKAWSQKHKDLVQALSRAADLENQKLDLIAKNGLGGEQVGMLLEEIKGDLARARSDLEFSIDFPKPIKPSDRSASPFAGPVNRGVPDRISIWTNRSSALLGSTIQATVGLANKNGPNSIADKNYSISLHCDGCVVNINSNESTSNTTVNIEKGLRSTETSIRVEKPRASIRATAKGLKPAIVNAYGCEEDEDLHLATDETQSSGFANGPPIPLNLIFEDSKNLPATNSVERIVRFGATGGAIVQLRNSESGSISGDNYRNGEPIRLPGSECVLKLDVRSPIVGHVSAPAFYRDKSSIPNPEFDFYYALRAADYIAGVIGFLLGFATKDALWKKTKVPWLRAFLTCLAGASLMFGLAYLKLVKNQTHPWMVFGACSLAGSIVGVGAAKVFFSNLVETNTDAGKSAEDNASS